MNNEIVEALKELKMEAISSHTVEIEEVTAKFTFEKENGEIKDPLKKAIYDMLQEQNEVEEVPVEVLEDTTEFSPTVDEFNTVE